MTPDELSTKLYSNSSKPTQAPPEVKREKKLIKILQVVVDLRPTQITTVPLYDDYNIITQYNIGKVIIT